MKLILTSLLGLLLLAPACGRPSQADCEKAVDHIRDLYGTAENEAGVSRQAAVRSCRGNADKDSVECVLAAKTKADLSKCEGALTDELFAEEKKKAEGKAPAEGDQPKPDEDSE